MEVTRTPRDLPVCQVLMLHRDPPLCSQNPFALSPLPVHLAWASAALQVLPVAWFTGCPAS